MLESGVLWFLLADGRRARVMVEHGRGAPLTEAFAMVIAPGDRYTAQDRAPRSFDSVGERRHAMDGGRKLHEEEEARFLRRLCARIDEAAARGAFMHLAIAAPPRALGILRENLASSTRDRIRAELAKDLLEKNAAALRECLRALQR